MHKKFLLILVLLLLSSCAGYNFKRSSNPLARYGIDSVSIPIFINQSIYPRGGVVFTREIRRVFNQFHDLEIHAGESETSDAVLVGIVESSQHSADAIRTTGTKLVSDGELKQSIGDRKQFYVPNENTYRLSLRIILIKRPTARERKLVISSLAPYLHQHPRVVLNEQLNLTGNFSRTVTTAETSDDGGTVNFTKNNKFFERSLEVLAKNAASEFKGVVLNVF